MKRTSLDRFLLAALAIFAGLVWRLGPAASARVRVQVWRLGALRGDALLAARRRASARPDAACGRCRAVLLAFAVECFKLVHRPALDAFRITLAGKLLLGRVFTLGALVATPLSGRGHRARRPLPAHQPQQARVVVGPGLDAVLPAQRVRVAPSAFEPARARRHQHPAATRRRPSRSFAWAVTPRASRPAARASSRSSGSRSTYWFET